MLFGIMLINCYQEIPHAGGFISVMRVKCYLGGIAGTSFMDFAGLTL